jgi:hypothetical protein
MDDSASPSEQGNELLLALVPRSALESLVRELGGTTPACDLPYDGLDRRAFQRTAVAVEVRLQPMDSSFAPAGEVFTAITRDISASGVGLVSTRPVKAAFLSLQLPATQNQPPQWVVRVSRCQPMGGFYDVGTSFVTALPTHS